MLAFGRRTLLSSSFLAAGGPAALLSTRIRTTSNTSLLRLSAQQQSTMASSTASSSSSSLLNRNVLDRKYLVPCQLAICQFPVGELKEANLETAETYIQQAAEKAQVVVLPEIWNGPYAASEFPKFAEHVPENPSQAADLEESPSVKLMMEAAKRHGIYLIGGSIAERDENGKIYNCSLTFGPSGELLARHRYVVSNSFFYVFAKLTRQKHELFITFVSLLINVRCRKVHLFDIDIPGKITFRESETLTAGASPTLFDTPYGRFAVGICYDMRFPQLASMLRKEGADYIIYPGAFNLTTGPLHWELLLRARALDNQCFVAGASQARNASASYQAWGHSSIVNPWGEVEATTEENPDIVYAVLDTVQVDKVREQIPVSYQLRPDIYTLNEAVKH